ncbi:hypothetical protein AB0M46_41215 [Dactylosporangium sp. NPDC051485]|uniref:hypothetical protein n=1 Tax=Dactylosporangium sp. NPDC051485 TaxID=3154846 RepID=UPI003436FCF9
MVEVAEEALEVGQRRRRMIWGARRWCRGNGLVHASIDPSPAGVVKSRADRLCIAVIRRVEVGSGR